MDYRGFCRVFLTDGFLQDENVMLVRKGHQFGLLVANYCSYGQMYELTMVDGAETSSLRFFLPAQSRTVIPNCTLNSPEASIELKAYTNIGAGIDFGAGIGMQTEPESLRGLNQVKLIKSADMGPYGNDPDPLVFNFQIVGV